MISVMISLQEPQVEVDIIQDLDFYVKFDAENDFTNYGSLGTTGTENSDVVHRAGVLGGSGEFDGVTDFVQYTDIGDVGSNDFSVCYWGKATNDQLGTVFNKGDISTGTEHISLYHTNGGTTKNVLQTRFASNIIDSGFVNIGVVDGKWHNICWTADRDGNALGYFDAVLQTITESDISANAGDINTTDNFFIGTTLQSGVSQRRLDATIDDFRLYIGKILTQTEITDIFNQRYDTKWT